MGEALGRRRLVAAILSAAMPIGAATGVQRSVMTLYTASLVGAASYLLTYMPILSFGLLKGTIDLVGGWFSDRFGRRPALILGSAVYLAGAATIYLGGTLEALVAGNLLVGAGEGLTLSAAMIALSDVGGSRQAFGFGLMESSVYGGYGVGSVIAGYVAGMRGYRDAFVVSVASASLALLVAVSAVRETRGLAREVPGRSIGRDMSSREVYRRCLRSWTLRVVYFLGHLANFSDTLIWGAFPLYLVSRGLPEHAVGWVQGAATLTWAASMPLTGRVSDRLGRKLPSAAGLALKAVGILGVYLSRGFAESLASAAVIGLGVGLYYPIMPAISTDVVPSAVRGRALGLYRAIRDFGYLTGALALGLVSAFGQVYAFALTASLLAAGIVAFAVGIKETRPFWPAYPETVRHSKTVLEMVRLLRQAISAHAEGDVDGVRSLASRIKELEDEADALRVAIDRTLWLSALSGQDKADFARLTNRVEKVAAYVLGSSRRLLLVEPEEVSGELAATLVQFSRGLEREVEMLTRAIEVLGLEIEAALPMIDEVGDLESELDSLHQKALHELEDIAKGVDVLTLLNLRELVQFLEYAADVAEDAADVLRVIVFKHSAWAV